jgi:hypothetical protein
LYKTSKNIQPICIHPEDGNCNVFQNIGKPSKFNEDHPQKPKSHKKYEITKGSKPTFPTGTLLLKIHLNTIVPFKTGLPSSLFP